MVFVFYKSGIISICEFGEKIATTNPPASFHQNYPLDIKNKPMSQC